MPCTRFAINHFVANKTVEGLPLFVLLFVIMAIGQGLLNIVWGKKSMFIDLNIGKDMRYELFRHTQTLSVEYFNTTPVGFILARIANDTNRMGSTFSWMLATVVDSFAYISFALITMIVLSPKLSIIMIVMIVILVIVSSFYQRKLIVLNRKTRRQNSLLTASYNENITGAQTIKSMGSENLISREFRRINHGMQTKTLGVNKMQRVFIPLFGLMGGITTAILLAVAIPMVQKGTLDVGTLSVFITYSFYLIPSIEEVTYILNDTISLQANVERINALMQTQPTVFDEAHIVEQYGDIYNPKTENFEEMIGDIEFSNISFRYPDSDTNVLEDFNLKIKLNNILTFAVLRCSLKTELFPTQRYSKITEMFP